MKIIVGLGNPGVEYENTRHNIGFWALDNLAKQHRILLDQDSYSAQWGKGRACGHQVILMKPQTFMNLSGKAVKRLVDRECPADFQLEDLIILHDEVDLKLGQIKLKKGGSDAGHNGLASITELLGPGYSRCRLGVGRPPSRKDVADHVLDVFLPDELPTAKELADRGRQAVEEWLAVGLSRAQNNLNQKFNS